ncbi:hypothetical protein IAT38_005415 [Cryptococcus sp. DSM 104549]
MATITARPSTPFPFTHTLHHGHQSSYFQPHPYTTQPLHFHMPRLPVPTPPSLLQRQASWTRTASPRFAPEHYQHASASTFTPTSTPTTSTPSTPYSSTSTRVTPPELIAPKARRASTTSAYSAFSISSPPFPTTPILESPLCTPPSPFALERTSTRSTEAGDLPELAEVDEPEVEVMPYGTPSQQDYARCWDLPSDKPSRGRSCALLPSSTSSRARSRSHVSRAARAVEKAARVVRPKLKRRDTPRPGVSTLGSLGMTREGSGGEGKVLKSVIDGGHWVVVA